jgi:D-alanyl-D-alanine dipeptidase
MKKVFLIPMLAVIFGVSFLFAQTAPPREQNKREADLVELIKLDKTIKLDIRYARSDNFVGRPVYPEARAFLQRPAAEALVRVHKELKKRNLGLVIFDGYRPWTITKLFWEVTPDDKRIFVADPKNGSRHNRGCAVDLSIYDLKTGKLLPMPSDFDDFSEKAHPEYKGGTDQERRNRDLLRRLMEAAGFTVNANEWWHFDYKDWREYGIYDISFSEIRNLEALDQYRIRRVEFAGNLTTRDRTVRQKTFLREGDLFSSENIRKSVAGINGLEIFEKITDQNISWYPDKADKNLDIVFYLEEKKKPKTISEAKIKEDKSLKKFFDEAGVTGGIYLYDLDKNQFTIFDRQRMDTGFVPASTSKIIHSLIFLDSGALRDENEVLKWDGTKHWVKAWEQDHNLRSAFKVSAVWFYVESSKRISQNKMQHYYAAANYGNAKINNFGTAYWVKGDLLVTPRQQIEFLVKFYKNELPFSTRSTDLVKDIMIEEKTNDYTLRAKTGWSDSYTPQVGWWVGYVERVDNVYFFALEMDIKKDDDAPKRKEITKKVLRHLKIIG